MNKVGSFVIGILVLAFVIVLANGFFIVTETQQVVITQFGKPVGKTVVTPGIHYKIPFIQNTTFFDKRFLEWEKAGVFEALWKAGLAEYDQMEGIAWRWQSIDGAMLKAPLAQEAVGPNPTDRGKKGEQASPAGGRSWRPVVVHRDRSQRE